MSWHLALVATLWALAGISGLAAIGASGAQRPVAALVNLLECVCGSWCSRSTSSPHE